ncbi:Hypothetical Protein FCC1311_082632 [Hondaea fermentalgiana]|uniref:Transmembrane protein n=1 Tax=Hondaea fermentalgiana TaxID=2315210 RepID=A0A2R5GQJ4_9STRA|nr:Hypothetical Protein FCC1311_082632 [Hondaea fermentalgiana]|eukprot:GBG32038.1 Hypothetical Protein FCC1311_082632 [Hondaea fermentalgiana]
MLVEPDVVLAGANESTASGSVSASTAAAGERPCGNGSNDAATGNNDFAFGTSSIMGRRASSSFVAQRRVSQAELSQLAETMLQELQEQASEKSWTRRLCRAAWLTSKIAVNSVVGLLVVGVFWVPRRFSSFSSEWRVDTEAKEPFIFREHSRLDNMGLNLLLDLSFCTGIPGSIVRAGMVFVIGMGMLAFLSAFNASSDSLRLLVVACLLPVGKELAYAATRALASHMAFSPGIKVKNQVLFRELAQVMHLWVQIVAALVVRLFVARFETSSGLALAITFQSAGELISRITMSRRDRAIGHIFTKMFSRQAQAVVMPKTLRHSLRDLSIEENSRRSSGNASHQVSSGPLKVRNESAYDDSSNSSQVIRECCKRHFHASVAASEMISEYLAIFITPIVLILFENAQLQLPFDQFAQHGVFRVAPLDHNALVLSTFLQFAAEFAVDVVCVCYEEISGCRTRGGTWHGCLAVDLLWPAFATYSVKITTNEADEVQTPGQDVAPPRPALDGQDTARHVSIAGLPDTDLGALAQAMLERDKAQAKASSTIFGIRQSFLLSVRLAVYSVVGLGVLAVFWMPRSFLPIEARWHANLKEKEPVILDLMNQDTLSEVATFLNFDISSFFFFPLNFILYVDASRREIAGILSITFVALILFRAFAFKHLGMIAATIPVLLPVFTLRLVLGPGTMVPMACLRAAINLGVVFVLYTVLSFFPANTDGQRLVMVAVVIPFFKEATYAGARGLAEYMAFSPQIHVAERRLRRELSWVIHLWVQVMMGLVVRLFVSRFESTLSLTAAVAAQSVGEIFSRVTMNWRDRQTSRILKILFRRKDSAVVLPSNLERSLRYVAPLKAPSTSTFSRASVDDFDGRTSGRDLMKELFQTESPARVRAVHEFCSRHFHSNVVAGEMLSEYLAILLAPLVLICFEHRQLQLPFDMYAQHGEFLVHPLNYKSLFIGTLLQLVAELAVDTLCLYHEQASGFDVIRAWRLRPPYFAWLLIWATWYASVACYTIVANRDNLDDCITGDMCNCAFGHGLHSQGVRELYCEYIYNVSSREELEVILRDNIVS